MDLKATDASKQNREPSKTEEAPPPAPGAGPDDTLILWMLSLTPTERLAVAQGFVDSTAALRNGQRS